MRSWFRFIIWNKNFNHQIWPIRHCLHTLEFDSNEVWTQNLCITNANFLRPSRLRYTEWSIHQRYKKNNLWKSCLSIILIQTQHTHDWWHSISFDPAEIWLTYNWLMHKLRLLHNRGSDLENKRPHLDSIPSIKTHFVWLYLIICCHIHDCRLSYGVVAFVWSLPCFIR